MFNFRDAENSFKIPVKKNYWPFQGGASFVDRFCYVQSNDYFYKKKKKKKKKKNSYQITQRKHYPNKMLYRFFSFFVLNANPLFLAIVA